MKLFQSTDELERFSTTLTGVAGVAGLALTAASGGIGGIAIIGLASGLLGLACSGRASLLGRRALRESSAPAVIERLALELERNGEQWLRGDTADARDLEAAVQVFRTYFADAGVERLPAASALIAAGLDEGALARSMLERAAERVPESFDPVRADTRLNRDVFLRLLEGAFRVLLAQPAFISTLQPAFIQTVLEDMRDGRAQGGQILKEIAQLRATLEAHDASHLSPGIKRYSIDHLAPSALLNPEYALVPFIPNGSALTDVVDWCNDPEVSGLAVQLIWGGGGRGKTRLLIEIARHLREGADGGATWMAGILKPDMTPRALKTLFARHPRVFIGIDRAEVRAEQVGDVLAAALEAGEGCRVRVVLTARTAGDWWERDLKLSSSLVGDVLRSPSTRALELEPLPADVGSRAALFRAANRAFEERLPAYEQVAQAERPELTLDAPHLGDPLLLLMAALTSVLGRQAVTERDLFEATLDSEREYWVRALALRGIEHDHAMLEEAAAVVTLIQGTRSPASSSDVVARVLTDAGRDRSLIDGIVSTLYRFYGRSDPGTLWPVAPDRLGEYLVMVSLARRPSLLNLVLHPNFVQAQGGDSQKSVLTVLTRLAKWRKEEGEGLLVDALTSRFDRLIFPAIAVGRETGDPIGRIAAEILERSGDGTAAAVIVDHIPRHSLALSELGVVATRLAVDEASVEQGASLEHRADHAGFLNDLSNRLDATGQALKGLACSERSVALLRDLERDGWAHARSGLAQALGNLSNRRQALEQFESSLVAIDEAIAIERELEAEQPGSRNDTLAAAFNNRAMALEGLDRRSESLQSIRSAARLTRRLVEENFALHAPNLAGVLGNLSLALSATQEPEEALNAAEESRDLFGELASRDPDAYRSGYALSLINLSICLTTTDRANTAHEVSAESVAILRELAADRPAAFDPHLAKALAVHSANLRLVAQFESALTAANESVDRYRALSKGHPKAYRRLLAAALGTLGHVLFETSRRREAVAAAEESVELFRDLFDEQPDAYRSALATALQSRAALLDEPTQQVEALKAIEEVVALRRDLVESSPGVFEEELATALGNLARVHLRARRSAEALGSAHEAVGRFRKLRAQAPAAYLRQLAGALDLLATCLATGGVRAQALAVSAEAVALNRDLVAEQAEIFGASLADSLTTQAEIYRSCGYVEQALAAIDEAIERRRVLVGRGHSQLTPKLANALTIRGQCLFQLQRDGAISAMEEAAELFRQLAAERPAAFAQAVSMIEADIELMRRS